MHKYSHLTSVLDKIAGDLQTKGLMDQAKRLDMVSNTLDAAAKEAFLTEAPSTMTKEYRQVVYDYILDALETLYKSEVGNNGIVNGLLRFWMGKRKEFEETTKDPMSYYQEQPVASFSKWLSSQSATSKTIPDKYFRNGSNTHGSTWDDLGHFMAILTTSGPQVGKKKMDLQEFMKRDLISEKTPTKFSPELEALFSKQASFHEVDTPFKQSISLVYALKPKDVPQGNYKLPTRERRATA